MWYLMIGLIVSVVGMYGTLLDRENLKVQDLLTEFFVITVFWPLVAVHFLYLLYLYIKSLING